MFFVVHCFPTTAMDFKTVDSKVVFGREVFPTGRSLEVIHVE